MHTADTFAMIKTTKGIQTTAKNCLFYCRDGSNQASNTTRNFLNVRQHYKRKNETPLGEPTPITINVVSADSNKEHNIIDRLQ